ncbi:MAG: gamma-glutamylcyclotransferase family protein [Cyanobacteriota bacterium]|nr:gamma-glutamylcyclotransferase family protein [Cyanobacteriota bacterium]
MFSEDSTSEDSVCKDLLSENRRSRDLPTEAVLSDPQHARALGSDAEAGERVFVYGSLRRGQRNHGLLQGARAEGEGSLSGAVLHDLGPFPMAVPGQGVVHGEVVVVPPPLLAELDRFEGVPRLYQRHRRRLIDGRWVWIYLGQARQVRHSPRLASGRWPSAQPRSIAPSRQLLALAALLLAALPVAAYDNQAACAAWRSSHGTARIQLGNQIGAENRLSKSRRFQESPPEAPVELYSVIDLRRACDERR